MKKFAVELNKVTKIFSEAASATSKIVAVHQVDLAIRSGEFFTLLGPSGCGKTTILRLIAGFETPTSGEIIIQDQPMIDVPANRRPVNLVFQNYALFPHLSVADNVGFGLAVKRIPKVEREPRVRQMLELVRLPDVSRRRPASLSGGQQQRVALARALVNEPAVLLLDEPLGALDLKLRKQMQLELKHIQQQVGITFIYVTHDQEEALTMSDRIAVINEGKVLQVGTPVEVYEKPVDRFVADFIGESNFLEARVAKIEENQVLLQIGSQEIIVERQAVESLSPGQQVTLTIRPEKVMLNHAADGEPGLTGEVREVVYLGTDTRLSIRLSIGAQIVVRKQNVNGHDLEEFAMGQTVQLAWAAHNACILSS